MPVNIGTLDQYVRIVLGLALIAYAFQDGLAIQGWHWAGLLGVVPLCRRHMRVSSRPACTTTVRAGSTSNCQNASSGPAVNGSIKKSASAVEI